MNNLSLQSRKSSSKVICLPEICWSDQSSGVNHPVLRDFLQGQTF